MCEVIHFDRKNRRPEYYLNGEKKGSEDIQKLSGQLLKEKSSNIVKKTKLLKHIFYIFITALPI